MPSLLPHPLSFSAPPWTCLQPSTSPVSVRASTSLCDSTITSMQSLGALVSTLSLPPHTLSPSGWLGGSVDSSALMAQLLTVSLVCGVARSFMWVPASPVADPPALPPSTGTLGGHGVFVSVDGFAVVMAAVLSVDVSALPSAIGLLMCSGCAQLPLSFVIQDLSLTSPPLTSTLAASSWLFTTPWTSLPDSSSSSIHASCVVSISSFQTSLSSSLT